MTDPLTLASGAVAAADKLHSWYENAQAAAKTQEQKDAAALVYFAAQVASAVASLDLEFRTTLNGIKKLDPTWTKERRDELADAVQTIATKESRLNQLTTATAFLRERTGPSSNWRERVLHRGGRDPKLDEALDGLLATGDEVLRLVGADRDAPTPYEVDVLEARIRGADDPGKVEQTTSEATRILSVIDRLTARSVPQAFGRFASAVSRKHGIPAPDWASVQ